MIQIPSADQILDLLNSLNSGAAYSAIIGILLLCGFGLPVPEDVILISTGLLASLGKISFPWGVAAAFFGVITGDATLFFLGRKFGRGLFKITPFRYLFSPARILAAEKQIREHQHFICFIGRFLPGLRAPVFSLSGALGVKPRVFFVQDGSAALLSVPLWIYVGYWFGSNWNEALHKARSIQEWILGFIVLVCIGYVIYRRKKSKAADLKRRAGEFNFPS